MFPTNASELAVKTATLKKSAALSAHRTWYVLWHFPCLVATARQNPETLSDDGEAGNVITKMWFIKPSNKHNLNFSLSSCRMPTVEIKWSCVQFCDKPKGKAVSTDTSIPGFICRYNSIADRDKYFAVSLACFLPAVIAKSGLNNSNGFDFQQRGFSFKSEIAICFVYLSSPSRFQHYTLHNTHNLLDFLFLIMQLLLLKQQYQIKQQLNYMAVSSYIHK
jgi:hypothetical protein